MYALFLEEIALSSQIASEVNDDLCSGSGYSKATLDVTNPGSRVVVRTRPGKNYPQSSSVPDQEPQILGKKLEARYFRAFVGIFLVVKITSLSLLSIALVPVARLANLLRYTAPYIRCIDADVAKDISSAI